MQILIFWCDFFRHSIKAAINKNLQLEINKLQQKPRNSFESDGVTNMEFSPTPHVSSVLINDRFSSYD